MVSTQCRLNAGKFTSSSNILWISYSRDEGAAVKVLKGLGLLHVNEPAAIEATCFPFICAKWHIYDMGD